MTKHTKLRYVLSLPVGMSAAIAIWFAVAPAHPIFWQLGPSGLVVPILAGLLGGLCSGFVAPEKKWLLATVSGCLIAMPLMAFLLRNGFSHFGRNPFYWYWPLWLIPTFSFGGLFARGIKNDV